MKVFYASDLRFIYQDILQEIRAAIARDFGVASARSECAKTTRDFGVASDEINCAENRADVDFAQAGDFGAGLCASDESFARSRLLFSEDELARFCTARVLIAGLGGVGGVAFSALARSCVATVGLDADYFEPSNQNRQLHSEHINAAKAEVFAALYGGVCLHAKLSDDICQTAWLLGILRPTLIIDAIDDVSAKTALIMAAHRLKIPLLSSGGAAKRIDALAVKISKWDETKGCALSRAVRSRLRRAKYRGRHKVVYSAEVPRTSGTALGSCMCASASVGLALASSTLKMLLKH